MTADLVAIAVNAIAPDRLAQFWAHALHWSKRPSDRGDIAIVPTDVTRFHVLFRAATHEKLGQNRIHFDLTTTSPDDQTDTVTELLAIGASHVDIGQGPGESHVVLADPEGNELCIVDPDNRFLASCPRLGAVNCDGTHALGCFWSEALGWPLVWDQNEETAIQAPDGSGPKITWSGPPLMPRSGVERFHLHVAPGAGADVPSTLDHLLALGATRLAVGQACPDAIALADVDGNKFCLVAR
ncbi:MAG: VOC family protein [Acidimicrobiales bacterium]